MTNTYTTKTDAIEQHLLPILGEHADDYDIDAIADEIFTGTGEGTNYRIVPRDLDQDKFNEILARHDNNN